MSTIKNKTTKNGSKLNENKNAKQVIKKNENIEICPQKSPLNANNEQFCTEEMIERLEKEEKSTIPTIIWGVEDRVKDTILRLRNKYASRSIISAEEFKSALAEIENAIK